jgi:hypothetical protein
MNPLEVTMRRRRMKTRKRRRSLLLAPLRPQKTSPVLVTSLANKRGYP